jgi:hypothetical protein
LVAGKREPLAEEISCHTASRFPDMTAAADELLDAVSEKSRAPIGNASNPHSQPEISTMQEKLMLDGRTFRAAKDVTFEQHVAFMDDAAAAGLLEPWSGGAEEFLSRVLASGRVMQLLAGALVEEGHDWSAESAKANAEFFAKVKGVDNIQQLQGALLGVLTGFFLDARQSSATSLSSSNGEAKQDRPGETADLSTPETGPLSSVDSPVEILNESSRS